MAKATKSRKPAKKSGAARAGGSKTARGGGAMLAAKKASTERVVARGASPKATSAKPTSAKRAVPDKSSPKREAPKPVLAGKSSPPAKVAPQNPAGAKTRDAPPTVSLASRPVVAAPVERRAERTEEEMTPPALPVP